MRAERQEYQPPLRTPHPTQPHPALTQAGRGGGESGVVAVGGDNYRTAAKHQEGTGCHDNQGEGGSRALGEGGC